MFKIILSYFLKCIKKKTKTENKLPRIVKTNKGKLMLLLKCAVCVGTKLRFIKKQDASGLLKIFRIKNTFKCIPLLSDILL